MESLDKFKKFKIEISKNRNYYGGSTAIEDITSTTSHSCGDEKRTWYAEDGSICCWSMTNFCCSA